MDTEITVTHARLLAAMAEWTRAQRAGECISTIEANRMPAERLARERADHLWALLSQPT